MRRIPAWSTTSGAFAFVWLERKRFLLLAFAPILIASLVNVLFVWMLFVGPMAEAPEGDRSTALSLATWVTGVVTVLLWVTFSVAWYRRYLVPGEDVTVAQALMWRMRQTRLLLRALAMILIVVGLWIGGGMVLSLVSSLFIDAGIESAGFVARFSVYLVDFALFVVLVLAFARLSMWLPAAAVDDPVKLAYVWQMTRHNAWQLVGVFLMVMAPFAVADIVFGLMFEIALLGIALELVAQRGTAGGMNLLLMFAIVFLPVMAYSYVNIAVGVTALSIAFRRLTGGDRGESVDISA